MFIILNWSEFLYRRVSMQYRNRRLGECNLVIGIGPPHLFGIVLCFSLLQMLSYVIRNKCNSTNVSCVTFLRSLVFFVCPSRCWSLETNILKTNISIPNWATDRFNRCALFLLSWSCFTKFAEYVVVYWFDSFHLFIFCCQLFSLLSSFCNLKTTLFFPSLPVSRIISVI